MRPIKEKPGRQKLRSPEADQTARKNPVRIKQEARESRKLAETLFDSVLGEAGIDASPSGFRTPGPEHPDSPRLPGQEMPSSAVSESATGPGKQDRDVDQPGRMANAVAQPVPDDRRITRTDAATTTTTANTTTTTTTNATRAATIPATTIRASTATTSSLGASPIPHRASRRAGERKEKEKEKDDAKPELRSAWVVPPSPGKKKILDRLDRDSPNTGHTAFWAAMHDGMLRLQDLPVEPGLRNSLNDAVFAYTQAAQADPASFPEAKTTVHEVAFIKETIRLKQTVFATPLMHRFQASSFLDVLEFAVDDRSMEGMVLLKNWLETKTGSLAKEEKIRLLEGIKKVDHCLPVFGTSFGITAALGMMAALLTDAAKS